MKSGFETENGDEDSREARTLRIESGGAEAFFKKPHFQGCKGVSISLYTTLLVKFFTSLL
jgi:hypothetical protein